MRLKVLNIFSYCLALMISITASNSYALFDNCYGYMDFISIPNYNVFAINEKCTKHCVTNCKSAFSAVDNRGMEINQDHIYNCIQQCQNGRPYSATPRTINNTPQSFISSTAACDINPSIELAQEGTSTYPLDNAVVTNIAAPSGETITIGLQLAPSGITDSLGIKEGVIYRCGIDYVYLNSTPYSSNPLSYLNTSSNDGAINISPTNQYDKVWSPLKTVAIDTGVIAKDGDDITISYNGLYYISPVATPNYNLKLSSDVWINKPVSVVLNGTNVMLAEVDDTEATDFASLASKDLQYRNAWATQAVLGLSPSAYIYLPGKADSDAGWPQAARYKTIIFQGQLKEFSNQFSPIMLQHYLPSNIDSPLGVVTGGLNVVIKRMGCKETDGSSIQYAAVKSSSVPTDSSWRPISWDNTGAATITISGEGNDSTKLWLRVAPMIADSNTVMDCSTIQNKAKYDTCQNALSKIQTIITIPTGSQPSFAAYGHYNIQATKLDSDTPVGSSSQYGLGSTPVSSFFNQSVSQFQKIFYGSNNAGGLVQNTFNSFLRDSSIVLMIQALMLLYIAWTGFSYMTGVTPLNQQDAVARIFKLAMVSALISPGAWEFFNTYLFSYFISANGQLMQMMVNQSDMVYHQAADPNNIFTIFDPVINLFTSPMFWARIAALMFDSIFSFIVMIIIVASVIIYFMAIFKILIMYLVSIIATAVLLMLAPVFISFILFKYTRELFDQWLSSLINFALQPIAIFVSFAFVGDMVFHAYISILGFPVCATCVFAIYLPFFPVLEPICIIPLFKSLTGLVVPDLVLVSTVSISAAFFLLILAHAVGQISSIMSNIIQRASGFISGINLSMAAANATEAFMEKLLQSTPILGMPGLCIDQDDLKELARRSDFNWEQKRGKLLDIAKSAHEAIENKDGDIDGFNERIKEEQKSKRKAGLRNKMLGLGNIEMLNEGLESGSSAFALDGEIKDLLHKLKSKGKLSPEDERKLQKLKALRDKLIDLEAKHLEDLIKADPNAGNVQKRQQLIDNLKELKKQTLSLEDIKGLRSRELDISDKTQGVLNEQLAAAKQGLESTIAKNNEAILKLEKELQDLLNSNLDKNIKDRLQLALYNKNVLEELKTQYRSDEGISRILNVIEQRQELLKLIFDDEAFKGQDATQAEVYIRLHQSWNDVSLDKAGRAKIDKLIEDFEADPKNKNAIMLAEKLLKKKPDVEIGALQYNLNHLSHAINDKVKECKNLYKNLQKAETEAERVDATNRINNFKAQNIEAYKLFEQALVARLDLPDLDKNKFKDKTEAFYDALLSHPDLAKSQAKMSPHEIELANKVTKEAALAQAAQYFDLMQKVQNPSISMEHREGIAKELHKFELEHPVIVQVAKLTQIDMLRERIDVSQMHADLLEAKRFIAEKEINERQNTLDQDIQVASNKQSEREIQEQSFNDKLKLLEDLKNLPNPSALPPLRSGEVPNHKVLQEARFNVVQIKSENLEKSIDINKAVQEGPKATEDRLNEYKQQLQEINKSMDQIALQFLTDEAKTKYQEIQAKRVALEGEINGGTLTSDQLATKKQELSNLLQERNQCLTNIDQTKVNAIEAEVNQLTPEQLEILRQDKENIATIKNLEREKSELLAEITRADAANKTGLQNKIIAVDHDIRECKKASQNIQAKIEGFKDLQQKKELLNDIVSDTAKTTQVISIKAEAVEFAIQSSSERLEQLKALQNADGTFNQAKIQEIGSLQKALHNKAHQSEILSAKQELEKNQAIIEFNNQLHTYEAKEKELATNSVLTAAEKQQQLDALNPLNNPGLTDGQKALIHQYIEVKKNLESIEALDQYKNEIKTLEKAKQKLEQAKQDLEIVLKDPDPTKKQEAQKHLEALQKDFNLEFSAITPSQGGQQVAIALESKIANTSLDELAKVMTSNDISFEIKGNSHFQQDMLAMKNDVTSLQATQASQAMLELSSHTNALSYAEAYEKALKVPDATTANNMMYEYIAKEFKHDYQATLEAQQKEEWEDLRKKTELGLKNHIEQYKELSSYEKRKNDLEKIENRVEYYEALHSYLNEQKPLLDKAHKAVDEMEARVNQIKEKIISSYHDKTAPTPNPELIATALLYNPQSNLSKEEYNQMKHLSKELIKAEEKLEKAKLNYQDAVAELQVIAESTGIALKSWVNHFGGLTQGYVESIFENSKRIVDYCKDTASSNKAVEVPDLIPVIGGTNIGNIFSNVSKVPDAGKYVAEDVADVLKTHPVEFIANSRMTEKEMVTKYKNLSNHIAGTDNVITPTRRKNKK